MMAGSSTHICGFRLCGVRARLVFTEGSDAEGTFLRRDLTVKWRYNMERVGFRPTRVPVARTSQCSSPSLTMLYLT